MRTGALALALLLAPAFAAASGGGALFDGSRGPLPRFELPAPPLTPEAAPETFGRTVATPDLIAAKARVGIDAELARLGSAPAGTSFTFGVIGDAEPGRFPWERIFEPGKDVFAKEMAALQARDPRFILQLGDFVSEGTVPNYRAHVAWMDADSTVPLLRCIGNHDRSRPNGDADKVLYDAVFGPRDYFFDYGGWRFIALDSSDRVVTPAQIAWLSGALNVPGPKVIYTHVPPAYLRHAKPLPIVASLPASAIEAERSPVQDFFENWFKEGSSDFERLVETSDVKAVFMGHIHAFWAADLHGVRYVISGGGGSPLYPLPPGYDMRRFAHYMTVAATPSGLTETVHPYRGTDFVLPPVRP
ncbi:MAG: metallophosphoesterase [Elusimicrobia bacterium]|nr:metallophosphoesterase [Elusimicrobiota bacterium]